MDETTSDKGVDDRKGIRDEADWLVTLTDRVEVDTYLRMKL